MPMPMPVITQVIPSVSFAAGTCRSTSAMATMTVGEIEAPAMPEGTPRGGVVVLQEIKSVDEGFPSGAIEDLGWTVHTHGQKSWNGVAILSRLPVEDVSRGLPGDDADEQSRFIEGTVIGARGAVRVSGLYLPNGNPAPGPKYDYKLAWMDRLRQRGAELLATEQPVVMLTAYTARMAQLLDPHCDMLLVGDSLGQVIYGLPSTVPVTLDMMVAHGAAVVRGARQNNLRDVSLDLPRDAKEVFVANPAVANAVVRSTRKVFVIGISFSG